MLEARSTAEALELAEAEAPMAVIAGLRPVAAGLELLERLRQSAVDPRVPVLVVSDGERIEHRVRAASAS